MIFGARPKEDDTVVAMLASALRRDIAFGTLLPDEKLKIDHLRQRYGGSNHSMRETLRVLSAEGLVEATSQRGFRVTSATEEDLRDILLLRLHVERLGLERAMARGGVAWEGRVIAAQHSLRRSEEHVRHVPDDLSALEWDEACRAYGAALIDASGSDRLIDLQKKFFNQSRRFRLALLREGRIDFDARARRQSELSETVLARDTERALATLEEDIRADMIADRT